MYLAEHHRVRDDFLLANAIAKEKVNQSLREPVSV